MKDKVMKFKLQNSQRFSCSHVNFISKQQEEIEVWFVMKWNAEINMKLSLRGICIHREVAGIRTPDQANSIRRERCWSSRIIDNQSQLFVQLSAVSTIGQCDRFIPSQCLVSQGKRERIEILYITSIILTSASFSQGNKTCLWDTPASEIYVSHLLPTRKERPLQYRMRGLAAWLISSLALPNWKGKHADAP